MEIIEIKEAAGPQVSVDRTLFLEMVKYVHENALSEKLNSYLEQKSCYDVVIDVEFVNHFKRFLLSEKRTDPRAKLAIMCDCSGGGGHGPTGVRG